ncbi:MAG: rhomboid family intramembrane serine protease [Pirellulaceae bacterium]
MIPYHTDAPLYHWPIATVVLMLLNGLLFFAVPSERLESPMPDHRVVGPDPFNPLAPAAPEGGPAAEAQWNADAFRIVEQPEPAEPGQVVKDRPLLERDHVGRDWNNDNGDGKAGVERGADADAASPPLVLALEHGAGLKPWQWLTAMFMHRDIVQLIFNLIALWAFGLVVEGKVGAPGFLTIFLGIGITQAGLEQSLTLFSSPSVSMGANAALLGLLGVAVVWAPRNEFDVLWGFGIRGGSIEVPILMFGFIQFAMELIGIATGSFGLSRSMMHMIGLILGLTVGWVWLRRGWVDCEGWDLISVWNGTETGIARDEEVDAEARQLVRSSTRTRTGTRSPSGTPALSPPPVRPQSSNQATSPTRKSGKLDTKRARRPKSLHPQPAASSSKTISQQRLLDVERLIAEGNLPLALKLLSKLRVDHPELQLPQPSLYGLIRALLAAKDYPRAIPLLREHIERFVEQRISLQLNLAKLLLHLQQPRKASEVLRGMQSEPLDATARGTWQQLAKHVQHQIDEGVMEISD